MLKKIYGLVVLIFSFDLHASSNTRFGSRPDTRVRVIQAAEQLPGDLLATARQHFARKKFDVDDIKSLQLGYSTCKYDLGKVNAVSQSFVLKFELFNYARQFGYMEKIVGK